MSEVVYTTIRGRNGGLRDLLRGMKVGKRGIVVDCSPNTAAVAACLIGKETARKYSTRVEENGIRIWRTA